MLTNLRFLPFFKRVTGGGLVWKGVGTSPPGAFVRDSGCLAVSVTVVAQDDISIVAVSMLAWANILAVVSGMGVTPDSHFGYPP